jgi:hypothetical protein
MEFEKLKKLILEQYRTQHDMKPFYDNLTEKEFDYTKKPVNLLYRIATKIEKVETTIDGKKETENIAKVGDWILTGVKGEHYVLSEKKVMDKYIIVDANTIRAKPSKIKAKEYQGKKIEFFASWGEKMILDFGDFLVNSGDEFYRIEKDAFKDLYARSK